MSDVTRPNDLDAFWMPFSANRAYKAAPKLLARASGMYYYTPDNREILDGTAGLWCVNAGHGREPITEAIQRQAAIMDFAPTFNVAHPLAFAAAARLSDILPSPLTKIFWTNSGSESADTALKIALAYHRARGDAQRTKLIGRARGYHGVGFGGMSVGGIGNNRRQFGALLPNVDHLPHTHIPENRFVRGLPEHGAQLADALDDLVALHGADTIAAVMVEPVAGSTGVLIPPRGYLARLRELCTKHGILLIFDEVITGFGRLGTNFGAEELGVTPDIMTLAKGLSNAAVPMGAVACATDVHDAIVNGSPDGIELFHGYTYSGHPLAAVATIATMDLHRSEDLPARAAAIAPYFADGAHSLRDCGDVVTDIRTHGLIAGIELRPEAKPTARAAKVFDKCFDDGLLVRTTGDIVALSPPLIIERSHVDRLFDILGTAIRAAS